MNHPEPKCNGLVELFYGDECDLRDERNKNEREDKAKAICRTCDYQVACLQKALVQFEEFGVWGGFSPGDRREFKVFLRRQGYRQLPTGKELMANVEYYRGIPLKEKRPYKKQANDDYRRSLKRKSA